MTETEQTNTEVHEDVDVEALLSENQQLRLELSALKNSTLGYSDHLSLEEYQRYGRQMLVPEVGILGQHKLKFSRVLVIGAGGLGSSAIAYLAAAGVGHLGIVDGDTVELSNLHRQIIHDTSQLGVYKAESAKTFCQRLNPSIDIDAYSVHLDSTNAFKIMLRYQVVLDCTDAPAIRYLINDTAAILHKPVVSASALKAEGQLSIYNYKDGPCYRCFYPQPPPSNSVLTCGDGGIVGPVVGIMGVMQAIETIKIITGHYGTNGFSPFLLMFSAYSARSPWRYIKMRGKRDDCSSCSKAASITRKMIENAEIDYELFCGGHQSSPGATVVPPEARVTVQALSVAIQNGKGLVVDVREPTQFNICSLPGSINIPLADIESGSGSASADSLKESFSDSSLPIYIVCRYGNDSQVATKLLRGLLNAENVFDVTGGLYMWSKEVDGKFPIY